MTSKIGSTDISKFGSTLTGAISTLGTTKATNVFSHITNSSVPNRVVNIMCDNLKRIGLLFMLYTDTFNNALILHLNLNDAPANLESISNVNRITWLVKSSYGLVDVNWVKYSTNQTKFKLVYPANIGTPVISTTQLDYADANIITRWEYAES